MLFLKKNVNDTKIVFRTLLMFLLKIKNFSRCHLKSSIILKNIPTDLSVTVHLLCDISFGLYYT